MKLKFTTLLPVAASLCIVFASCKKNDAVTKPSQQANQLTQTTTMIGAMESESDLQVSSAVSTNSTADDCPVITYNPSKDVYPFMKITDYGDGCADGYGVVRKGKEITTVYADKNTAPAGKTISVTTYSGYYVDDVSVSGSLKVSIVHPASSGHLVLKVIEIKDLSDGLGNTSSFVSISTRTQVEGGATGTDDDNVFEINVNAYGTAINGDSSMVVWKYQTDPNHVIVKPVSCDYRTKGALKVTLKQLSVETNEVLDYGNGDCDNEATLKVGNGEPYPITLPFHFFATQL